MARDAETLQALKNVGANLRQAVETNERYAHYAALSVLSQAILETLQDIRGARSEVARTLPLRLKELREIMDLPEAALKQLDRGEQEFLSGLRAGPAGKAKLGFLNRFRVE